MRVAILLGLVSVGYALVLATTLHSLTCDQGRDLALAAFCCRACEGAFIAVSIVASLSLLSISEAPRGADVPDEALRLTIAELLFKAENWTVKISSICFAAGSTLYSYLFLRARSIPVSLAWL